MHSFLKRKQKLGKVGKSQKNKTNFSPSVGKTHLFHKSINALEYEYWSQILKFTSWYVVLTERLF